jgi:hypothetical protein
MAKTFLMVSDKKLKYNVFLLIIFLIQVYLGSKFCPSVLETVGLRVPTRHLRDFPLFYVCPTIKNYPARCASAGTLISLQDKMFPLNTFYYKQDTYCFYVIY